MPLTPSELLRAHGADNVCHLATIGRRSGRRRAIEIWFATDGRVVYFLAGGRHRAHWVRNIVADDRVQLRLGTTTVAGRGRVIDDPGEELRARQLVAGKYQRWTPGAEMSGWATASLPVAVELDPA